MTRYSKSRGMALVISLLLLIAITLMAVSAIRNTTMQEKMSANLNDREVAKQVAEATLSYACNSAAFCQWCSLVHSGIAHSCCRHS